MKDPTREQVAEWVAKAWDDIPADMIRNAFAITGLSNSTIVSNEIAELDMTEVEDEEDDETDRSEPTDQNVFL